MKDKILTILSELRPECDFSENVDFVKEGMLDSLDIVAIIDSIDEQFGVTIPGMEILPENFSSIHSIINMINRNKK